MAYRAFRAQYPGTCDICEGDIKPGEMIQNATEGQRAGYPYEHVSCPEDTPQKACPNCFMVHAPHQKECA